MIVLLYLDFNNATVDRIPDRSIPTMMTHQHYRYKASLVQYGKLAMMEKKAFLTPKGNKNLTLQKILKDPNSSNNGS